MNIFHLLIKHFGKAIVFVAIFLSFSAVQAETISQREIQNLKTAAINGDAEAQVALAGMYCFGHGGILVNSTEGVKWARMAAEQGVALGQAMMGALYQEGCGVEKNDQEAIKWLEKAAAQGEVHCIFYMAELYIISDDPAVKNVKKGFQLAMDIIKRRKDKEMDNEPRGELYVLIAACYAEGRGCDKDFKQATAYFQKAADLGDATGLAAMGEAHYFGIGAKKNKVEALRLLDRAKAAGNEDASTLLDTIEAAEHGDEAALAQIQEMEQHMKSLARHSTPSRKQKSIKKSDESSDTLPLILSVLAALGVGGFAGFAYQRRKTA